MEEISINLVNISVVITLKYGDFYFLPACVLSYFNHFWLFETLWTGAHQAPLFMGLFLMKIEKERKYLLIWIQAFYIFQISHTD